MKKLSKSLLMLSLVLFLFGGFPAGVQNVMAGPGPAQTPNGPIGSRINIAINIGVKEKNPVAANCYSNQYLVVYESDGDIHGQRLNADGSLLGSPFEIYYSNEKGASDPAVACSRSYISGVFLVVFSYDFYGDGSDIDLYGQLVYDHHQSSGSQLKGSRFNISADGSNIDETNAAVACGRPNDRSCLVMFEYSGSGNGDIYGQRVDPSGASGALEGDRFQVVDAFSKAEALPDIVWNRNDGRYVIIWQKFTDDAGGYYRIIYTKAYDSEQGAGSNEFDGSRYQLLNPGSGDFGYAADHIFPSIAYNPHSDNYMATFVINTGSYLYSHAARFDYTKTSLDIHLVNSFTSGRPAVVFSGGADPIIQDKGQEEFMVAYASTVVADNHNIYGAALPDKDDASGYVIFNNLLGSVLQAESWFNDPDIAGSYYNGQYLVVYEQETYATGEYNIYGRMVGHLENVYLPMVVR